MINFAGKSNGKIKIFGFLTKSFQKPVVLLKLQLHFSDPVCQRLGAQFFAQAVHHDGKCKRSGFFRPTKHLPLPGNFFERTAESHFFQLKGHYFVISLLQQQVVGFVVLKNLEK